MFGYTFYHTQFTHREHSHMKSDFKVGQVASDFTKKAYVVKYLIRVVR